MSSQFIILSNVELLLFYFIFSYYLDSLFIAVINVNFHIIRALLQASSATLRWYHFLYRTLLEIFNCPQSLHHNWLFWLWEEDGAGYFRKIVADIALIYIVVGFIKRCYCSPFLYWICFCFVSQLFFLAGFSILKVLLAHILLDLENENWWVSQIKHSHYCLL